MSKKHNGLLWRVLKIWGTCLVIAFCVLGAIAIKRVGVPVVTMYKAVRTHLRQNRHRSYMMQMGMR